MFHYRQVEWQKNLFASELKINLVAAKGKGPVVAKQGKTMDPIEHRWDELERRERARPFQPTSVFDLTTALLE